MGHDVLVGNSGLASDRAGIDWLQRYLGPEGYRIHEVPLTSKWLHLDCIFAVVRRGLCICNTSGLKHGLPSILNDWEVIAATPEEAHALGCNTMCLEENVVLMAQEHIRLIAELEKRQATVVTGFRTDIASQWGGGIRCASHPLLRDE
ncbi:arginine deiminase-related protein [Rhodococcus jostii]|uniref:arginine deiminase-related protein n=1 Tax=Rhodococcus jostii TaxID=132919 RepID=UPI0009F505EF|nr:arginine deiminase-related protein [Rhodococcus jostii]